MILGLDWGEKKIGVAVVYEEMAIASVVGTVKNDTGVFCALTDIVHKYDITKIVIGKSAHMSQNDNVEKIELFGMLCKKNLHVPVVYATEIFSTHQAQMNLKEAGKKKIDANDDGESARVILQSYIDAQNEKI
ncbi:MAG: Holliday junction resolvase RuvX [Parcubacteria group bacterium]|jgi:putative Holliday junction resolvase